MEKIKEELRQLKPKIILVSFAAVLLLIVLNYHLIIGSLKNLLDYFSPFLVAVGLAFVLNVPMMKIEKFIDKHTKENNLVRRFSRPISIVLSLIIVIALVSFVGIIVLPEFFASIGNIFLNLTSYLNNLSENIGSLLRFFNVDFEQFTNSQIEAFLANMGLDYSNMIKEASNWVLGTGQGVVDYVIAAGNSLFMFFMSLTISIYLLASKENFLLQMKKTILAIFPYDIAQDILECSKVANDIFGNFIGGKCVECVVVFVLLYTIMTLFNVPFSNLIACLCGALTIIPVFGSLIATIIGCLLLLSVNIWYPVIFFFLYWLVQIVDGNFIYPKFIGSSMGLPAVWILTSVLVFGSMYGVLGALLAAPTTACVYTFFGNFVQARLDKKQIKLSEDGEITKE